MAKLQMILWPVFTILMFGVALFFNYTASTGLVSDLDVGEVSDKYPIEITPAGWTFSIWGFIYIWQALWIVYTLYLTCKYGNEMSSIVFGKYFWFSYNVANLCNALWLIIWVNELVIAAAVTLPLIAAGLVTSAVIAHKFLYELDVTNPQSYDGYGTAADSSPRSSEDGEKWLTSSKWTRMGLYIAVCNGIPFYATWTVVASHLNVGIALVHGGEHALSESAASFLMLSILTVVILAYWFCDFYRFRFALRYTYSPYAVLLIAFAGVVTNEEKGGLDVENRPSSAFALALLVLAALGTVAKVVMGVLMRNTPNQTLQSV